MTDYKYCPICKKKSRVYILPFPETGLLMTSDSKIGSFDGFIKYFCKSCQIAFGNFMLGNDFYKNNYSFNNTSSEEHYFFINGKVVSRSQIVFDSYLINEMHNCSSLLEIGCGKGSLLQIIKDNYSNMKLKGIEPSQKASMIGKDRGFDVFNGTLQSFINLKPKEHYDAIIAVGVIEHIDDPVSFIKNAISLLNKDGLFFIICPDASFFSYDLFFADHLFHFTPFHISEMLKNNGVKVKKGILNAYPINNFQCIIGQLNTIQNDKDFISFPGHSSVLESFNYYLDIFSYINENLSQFENIIIFGGSEVFTLLYAYTDLNRHKKIQFIIDEMPKGKEIFEIPIYSLDEIDLRDSCGGEVIILAINQIYYSNVIEKIIAKEFKNKIMLPFHKNIISCGDNKSLKELRYSNEEFHSEKNTGLRCG